MLQWHTNAGWSHRAYWGENVIDWGKDGTPERLRMGGLPASGQWVRLEVPVASLKMAPGTVIDGWAFTQHGGTVYWDTAGITTPIPQDGQLYDSLTAWTAAQRGVGAAGLPANLRAIVLSGDRSKWTEAQVKEVSQVLRRARLQQDEGGLRAAAIEAGGGRAEAEGDGAAVPHDDGLPREGRRAEAGVLAQTGRVRSAG